MTPSQYLIEYRDTDGNLLLPQYGGCFHEPRPLITSTKYSSVCVTCGKIEVDRPNLATPQGFFDLKRAMEKRGDWLYFKKFMSPPIPDFCTHDSFIDPDVYLETVASYLKEREGK